MTTGSISTARAIDAETAEKWWKGATKSA